jgi:hypothetical protein
MQIPLIRSGHCVTETLYRFRAPEDETAAPPFASRILGRSVAMFKIKRVRRRPHWDYRSAAMRNVFMHFVFAAVAIALSAGHAQAQWGYGDYPDPTGTGLCSADVTFWVAAAKEARDRGCAGAGPEWSTDAKTQGSFCLSASDSDRVARTNTMKRYLATGVCDICAILVDWQMRVIGVNLLRRCGFSNPDGRWTPNRKYQIDKCVTANTLFTPAARTAYQRIISVEMLEQEYICEQTHPNPNCVSCHSSQAPAALQKNPLRASTKSSDPSGTTNRRATLPKGSATSGNDLAKPSGSSSAMDSLSGDNQLRSPASNQRVTIPDGNRPAPPKAIREPTPFEKRLDRR